MEQLFTLALGLQSPWQVNSVDFKPEEGAIHFAVVCTGAHQTCPACGALSQPVHDRKARTWQHLNFFQYRALIHAELPRVACGSCGKTTQMEAPWARPRSGFTLLMEALIMTFAKAMPVSEVARLLKVSQDRVWLVINHHVGEARGKESFEGVTALGVDETAAKRGQQYVTLFYDLDHKRLLFGTEGRDQTTFDPFLTDFAAHGGKVEAIKVAAIDMSKAYQAGLRTRLPQAEICFDPFHLAQLVHDALDQVRRTEARTERDLKGTRWTLLKDPGKQTRKQINTLHWLQRSGLKTAQAWKLKERFRDILQLTGDAAVSGLKAWISWARRCRLEPFKRVASTLKSHQEGILNALRYRRHNGAVEAMNGQIQAAKARARGYGTITSLLNIAYLICGKLSHLPANPYNLSKATAA